MQVAVISDPHGDLVALRAVVADLEARGLDEVLVAGDLAQGGPQPAEVVDMLVAKGWPIARGNSDDFLVELAAGRDFGSDAPADLIERGRWCVARLGKERVARLAALPMELRRPWAPNGPLVVVHATPWSTEEVVLPDASEEAALRMVTEASAGVLAYGHIHSAYHRRVGDCVLLSAGAISGSNDADARPAYTILTFDQVVKVQVIRVDCPVGARLDAYTQAGLEPTELDHHRLSQPGPWPLHSSPGKVIQLWP
ncbi:MAG TPA: metallophosphoesterase family protein [Candidatus Eisenbacteria bacterium]|nr:metallophosphoesterase family protein [Candidatus Eisenbacteria bacterium]